MQCGLTRKKERGNMANVITVTFDKRYEIWKAADESGTRPALGYVCIDPSGILVATDGFILGIVKADVGGLDKAVLVSAEAFEAAAQPAAEDRMVARLALDMEMKQASVRMNTHTNVWPFFDGEFPRWRQLLPDLAELTFGIPVGGYNPQYTVKAQAVIGGAGITGAGQGKAQSFIIVDSNSKALVIVMPMFYQESIVMAALGDAYRNLGIMPVTPVVSVAS